MLTVTAVGSGKKRYYLPKKEETLIENFSAGIWLGKGAERLGLKDRVEPKEFGNLFNGYSPDGEKRLILNAGSKGRRPGWDLMFAPPKSVDIVWSLSAPGIQAKIERDNFQAVCETLDYLEGKTFSRAGDQSEAGLIVAAFLHKYSRSHDPLLHTHCLTLNCGIRADGGGGAITSKQFYDLMRAGGAMYRAEFARRLEESLGVEIRRKDSWFEIAGIPEGLIEQQSKRKVEILRKLHETGYTSHKAKEMAALTTREEKQIIPIEELYLSWESEARQFGLTRDNVSTLFSKQIEHDVVGEIQMIVNTVSKLLVETNATFTEGDVTRLIAEEAQGRGLGIKMILSAQKGYLQSDDVIEIGLVGSKRYYTTRERITSFQQLNEKQQLQYVLKAFGDSDKTMVKRNSLVLKLT